MKAPATENVPVFGAISIDGGPAMEKIEGSDYEHVVNTAFLIVKDDGADVFAEASRLTMYHRKLNRYEDIDVT